MAAGIPRQPVAAPRARRWRTALLALTLGALAAGATPSGTLVRYSFDDGTYDTGPDTFAVFQKARGRVRLTGSFRYSGYRSVEVRDVAGDRAFPELQGYFPLRREGTLYAHFALMSANPNEQLNVALAGPAWFTLRKDGIAFWLQTRGGSLFHYSDSMPKRLLPMTPLTWYLVDVAYDIDAGTYNLEIRQENLEAPLVSLKQQTNAFNEPGSAVDKFSFIGDNGHDTSAVVYYVDDVLVTIDRPIEVAPLLAPGRRKLFVDIWHDALRELRGRPGCLPSTEMSDFGLTPALLDEIRAGGMMPLLVALVSGRSRPLPAAAAAATGDDAPSQTAPSAGVTRVLSALRSWREGCAALGRGDAATALPLFRAAASETRDGRLFELSEILTLAALRRWEEADPRLSMIYATWADDPRFPLAFAMIGLARDDLGEADIVLRGPAERVSEDRRFECALVAWSRQIDWPLVQSIKSRFPDDWSGCLHEAFLPEQYFSVLLWRKAHGDALRFATRMADRLWAMQLPADAWRERAGDAALLAGDARGALRAYKEATRVRPADPWLLAKLSDVAFLLGDARTERALREELYGRLEEEEELDNR